MTDSLKMIIKEITLKKINTQLLLSIILSLGIIMSFYMSVDANAITKWSLSAGYLYPGYSGDTRDIATVADNNLDNAGYYCVKTTNLDISTLYNDLSSDYVYMICGHAYPGYMKLYDGSNYQYLYADGGVNSTNVRYIDEMSSLQLNKTLLAIYAGCNSGLTSSSYGNLLTKSVEKGADCAIGWSTEVRALMLETWMDEFTLYLKNGYTVRYSMSKADVKVNEEHSYDGYTSNHVYAGNSYTFIN